jgi:hypothetical protein
MWQDGWNFMMCKCKQTHIYIIYIYIILSCGERAEKYGASLMLIWSTPETLGHGLVVFGSSVRLLADVRHRNPLFSTRPGVGSIGKHGSSWRQLGRNVIAQ